MSNFNQTEDKSLISLAAELGLIELTAELKKLTTPTDEKGSSSSSSENNQLFFYELT